MKYWNICLLLWRIDRVTILHTVVSGSIPGRVKIFNKKIPPWEKGWWSRTSVANFCSKYT